MRCVCSCVTNQLNVNLYLVHFDFFFLLLFFIFIFIPPLIISSLLAELDLQQGISRTICVFAKVYGSVRIFFRTTNFDFGYPKIYDVQNICHFLNRELKCFFLFKICRLPLFYIPVEISIIPNTQVTHVNSWKSNQIIPRLRSNANIKHSRRIAGITSNQLPAITEKIHGNLRWSLSQTIHSRWT